MCARRLNLLFLFSHPHSKCSLTIYLSIFPSIFLSICLFIYLSICPSFHLSFSFSCIFHQVPSPHQKKIKKQNKKYHLNVFVLSLSPFLSTIPFFFSPSQFLYLTFLFIRNFQSIYPSVKKSTRFLPSGPRESSRDGNNCVCG